MIFDSNNILRGFTNFLFNTKTQAMRYIKLLPEKTKNTVIVQSLHFLNSKQVNKRVNNFEKLRRTT